MALRVVSHSPTINAIDVPRNSTIVVKFNKGIVPSSLDYSNFSVHDADTFATIPGTATVKYTKSGFDANSTGVPDTIEFTPHIPFNSNTKYQVFVHRPPNGVIAADGEQLISTYSFSFETGNAVLDAPISVITDTSTTNKPTIVSASYDSDNNSVLLTFDKPLSSTFTDTTTISFFTINPTGVYNLSIPLSGYVNNNNLVLQVSDTDDDAINYLPHITTGLNVNISAGLVFDQYTNANSQSTLYGIAYKNTSYGPYIPDTTNSISALEVVSAYPTHTSSNVKDINSIEIRFNTAPLLSGINIYDYIEVTSKGVLE